MYHFSLLNPINTTFFTVRNFLLHQECYSKIKILFDEQIIIRTKKIAKKIVESHVCPHCGISFGMRRKLTVHISRCKSKPLEMVKCQFCGKDVEKIHLSSHEMEHIRSGVLHTCEFCGKELSYKTYVRHVAKHKKGKPPKKECPICHKFVVDLKPHIQRHDQIRPYPCGVCGKTFADKRNVQRHADQSHKGASLPENVPSLEP